MATNPCIKVARGLLLYGRDVADGKLTRDAFYKQVGVKKSTFRAAGDKIGSKAHDLGLRFFDTFEDERIRFGPGAGLVVGISLGTETLRAAVVDANGELHHAFEGESQPGQLKKSPEEVLGRIKEAYDRVVTEAKEDEGLLVNGKLPFLGVSTAWPAPLNRAKHPVGQALSDPRWHSGKALPGRVQRFLKLDDADRVHTLNDVDAAAIAVAHRQTTQPRHRKDKFPRLAIVLRIAGGIGASTIVVEPPRGDEDDADFGRTSGFASSILIGGANYFAGEIGHSRIEPGFIDALNDDLPAGIAQLKPQTCSCVIKGEAVPPHLEAYAGFSATAKRIAPRRAEAAVIGEMLDDPQSPLHDRVLGDIGRLVAHALAGPVAMLNPATITLTGSLGVKAVAAALDESLSGANVFGDDPEVIALEGDENKFVRVKGAGLAVIREHVHREIPTIFGGKKSSFATKVRELTVPL